MQDLTTIVLSYEDVKRQTQRGAKLVDVRTPQEFVSLHLAGALPLAAPRFGFQLLSQHHLTLGDRVIVIAASPVTGQVAAQEIDLIGVDVVGIFANLPRTWAMKGLPVQSGELIFPERFLSFLHDHPNTDVVDVREPVESAAFPFPQVTRHLPYSLWPQGAEALDRGRPIIFLGGRDDRSILAAQHLMVADFPHVGYVVGGYAAFMHPRVYDPKAAARTTAHHGVFI